MTDRLDYEATLAALQRLVGERVLVTVNDLSAHTGPVSISFGTFAFAVAVDRTQLEEDGYLTPGGEAMTVTIASPKSSDAATLITLWEERFGGASVQPSSHGDGLVIFIGGLSVTITPAPPDDEDDSGD